MKPTSLIKGLSYLPEVTLLLGSILFVGADFFYNTLSPLTLFSSVITLTLLALLKWKSRYVALAFSLFSGGKRLFFLLALLAEFAEFPAGSKDGLQMLGTGALIFLTSLLISVLLPLKYFRKEKSLSQLGAVQRTKE